MTARLEKAIRQLPPDKVEQVTNYAESLVQQVVASRKDERLKLDWVGAAAHLNPEHKNGVEAAHAAAALWRQSLDEPVRD